MKTFLRFLRDWTLPVAIAAGTLSYLLFYLTPALDKAGDWLGSIFDTIFPLSVFATLFVTYCKVDFHQMRPHRWHIGVLVAQTLLVIANVAAILCLPALTSAGSEGKLLLEAILTCIIAPSATAAPVIVGKLGGNISTMSAFTVISSFSQAIAIPIVFPLLEQNPGLTFWAAFLTILKQLALVLVLPLILGWTVQHTAQRLHRWIAAKPNLSFYCWAFSLAITAGITVKNIVHSSASLHLLAAIAMLTLVVCFVQYALGRAVGRWLGEPLNSGQALFQKNTALSIWVSYMYLHPVASVGAGCYVLWQNVINSLEIWKYRRAALPVVVFFLLFLSGVTATAQPQEACLGKLSPMLRHAVAHQHPTLPLLTPNSKLLTPNSKLLTPHSKLLTPNSPRVCAFVLLDGSDAQTLEDYGCRSLAHYGPLHIADIPLSQLAPLSASSHVLRIEARESHAVLLDTTLAKHNVPPLHQGTGLPQAFTGKGVVMGVEDIGFDLTHPNFRTADLSELRIKRFWDHLSEDTIGSNMYVGAEYTTPEAILQYAHSRDGLDQYHGTHTLGIAAGTGLDTPFRGIAFESDICLVSNTVTDDMELISPEDLYKYTSATDMLGFKYILDYAEAEGKPCVVSFSEGSHQDFLGDDLLMYAFLDSLVGPGRIIVASAGNEGHYSTYLHKPRGDERLSTYIANGPNNAYVTLQADADFHLAIRFYIDKDNPYEHLLHAADVIAEEDSLVEDTLLIGEDTYIVKMASYPSCYNPGRQAYELYIQVPQHNFGYSVPVEVEMMGREADIEMFRVAGKFKYKDRQAYDEGPGEASHSIYSPGSAPAVICVGATSYRQGYTDINAKYQKRDWGANGVKAAYSSVGPTFDGRVKPDVVANGTNVISSSSSFYLEQHNNPNGMYVYTGMSEYEGRQYPWRNESGTSMSTPAVAGIIALWLQAKPDLTPDDIRRVLANTCRPLDDQEQEASPLGEAAGSLPNNLWGYGEIDAYSGLLYILGYSGIREIERQQPLSVSFSLTSQALLSILLPHPSQQPIRLSIFSTAGQHVMQLTLPQGQDRYDIPLSHLPHGVYALQLNTKEPGIHGSTLIRR